jgi:hypothetical protein
MAGQTTQWKDSNIEHILSLLNSDEIFHRVVTSFVSSILSSI